MDTVKEFADYLRESTTEKELTEVLEAQANDRAFDYDDLDEMFGVAGVPLSETKLRFALVEILKRDEAYMFKILTAEERKILADKVIEIDDMERDKGE